MLGLGLGLGLAVGGLGLECCGIAGQVPVRPWLMLQNYGTLTATFNYDV